MRYIVFFLLLISAPVLANDSTWLCIGEREATVSEKEGGLGSDSSINNDKWIITNNGLKRFGDDYVILDACTYDKNGRLASCQRSGPYWGGLFMMKDNNVFFMSGMYETERKEILYFWVGGKCNKL